MDVCQFLEEKGADLNAKMIKYDTQPYTNAYEHSHVNICFVCDVLILVLAEEAPRCIGLLKKAT